MIHDERLVALRERAVGSSRELLDQSSRYAQGTFPFVAGPPLAASIRFSRDQALQAGARPIPQDVREALEPYFEDRLLDKVQWTLASRSLGLGGVLAGWYYKEGAVTLNDVIVFSNVRTSQNVWLWAHELTHVEQYERLGVTGFAARYTNDWLDLESAATANAERITADIRQRKQASRQMLPIPTGLQDGEPDQAPAGELSPPDPEAAPPVGA